MSEPLEELRAQRAQIKKHLDWLDAQIATAADQQSQQPRKTVPQSPATIEHATGNQLPAASPVTSTTVIEPKASTAPNASTFDIDESHIASSASALKKAQFGCLAFFIGITLLFLFLLFGLPYLMD